MRILARGLWFWVGMPEWLGSWPAAAGLLAFTWLELVYRCWW